MAAEALAPLPALPPPEVASAVLELLERLARLPPPPRIHRHRYHGVLALEVVGVVADARDWRWADGSQPELYVPARPVGSLTL